MAIVQRSMRMVQAFLKSYGPSSVKKALWDKEFSSTKWDFIDNTAGDCIYPFLERHSRGGSILDLGCGPGNTANELAEHAYHRYVGIDISEAALQKARVRSEENGRGAKNTFVQSDFLSYSSPQKFDVILFRESLYHVPLGKVKTILDKYASFLKPDGVFIVRMALSDGEIGEVKRRPSAMLKEIETNFEVLEEEQFGKSRATVVVFRPRSSTEQ